MAGEAQPGAAVAARHRRLAARLDLPDEPDAVAPQAAGESRPHAGDLAHRQGREERKRFRAADNREAPRLVEVRRELGQQLVVAQADRHGDADLALDPARERRKAPGRLGALEIHIGFVDGNGLHEAAGFAHERAHFRADAAVALHVGADDHGVGAGCERLEHGHRGADAVEAGDVAGGADHAAPPAADDNGFVGEIGIVALFHRGVEGVAVDMRDGERAQLRVGDDARAGAGGAAPRKRRARRNRGTARPSRRYGSAARARAGNSGASPAESQNAIRSGSWPRR